RSMYPGPRISRATQPSSRPTMASSRRSASAAGRTFRRATSCHESAPVLRDRGAAVLRLRDLWHASAAESQLARARARLLRARLVVCVKLRRAPMPSEHDEQVAILAWARAMQGQHPELTLLHASQAGARVSWKQAKKLKAEGMESGVPDLHL